MESKKKEITVKLSELPKYEKNPFMVQLKGKMYLQPRANTIIAKGQEIVDTTTGEIIKDDVLIGKRRIVDKSQFAKIYASEIGVLFGLSKPAINVFMYLTKEMDYDNRTYFNYYKDFHKLGYKVYTTCYKGILELLQKNIIALDVRENMWWLNPTIVCKGERFAKYTEYVTEDFIKEQQRKQKLSSEETIQEDYDMECRENDKRVNYLKHRGVENPYDKYDDDTLFKVNSMNNMLEREYYNKGIIHELDGEIHFKD